SHDRARPCRRGRRRVDPGNRAMKWPRLSRRGALRLGLVAAALLPLELLRERTAERGPGPWLRWTFSGRARDLFGPSSTVSVVRQPDYGVGVPVALAAALQPLGLPDLRGKRVVLKPNLIDHVPDFPTTTHPAVLDAAIAYFQAAGARVTVAE